MAEQQPATAQQVTLLLARARDGDCLATRELFPLVYEELRRLADHYLSDEGRMLTLQTTALVHEAFLRLMGPGDTSWENRRHFFGAASQAMRRILVDHARRRLADKRGAGLERVTLADLDIASPEADLDLVGLDSALEDLGRDEPRLADVVTMRVFAGMSIDETAQAMELSPATVKRDWTFARAWLADRMGSHATRG